MAQFARHTLTRQPPATSLLRRIMPSMFQRRLRLLALAVIAVTSVLSVQMARLTVVRHPELRRRAEAVLTRTQLIPTSRGRILDRKQRLLAFDKPAYDVAVNYRVINGQWAYDRALADARREHRAVWPTLHSTERRRLANLILPRHQQQVEGLWHGLSELAGTTVSEVEQTRAQIVQRVGQLAGHIWWRRLQENDDANDLADVATPISEQVEDHPILTGVSDQTIAMVRRMIELAQRDEEYAVWGQVSIVPAKQREYPLSQVTLMLDRHTLPGPLRQETPIQVTVSGVASHILGAMRPVYREDIEGARDAAGQVVRAGRPFRQGDHIDLGGYLPGDRAGGSGVEASQEQRLRGVRGRRIDDLETMRQRRIEPIPGGDVVLTIDAHLQARIGAIMDPALGLMRVQPWTVQKKDKAPDSPNVGDRVNGAALVLDVATGQVLAAVSAPTFGRERIESNPDAYFKDRVNQPYLNRPVAAAYPPGSTVKPLVLAAAITERRCGYDEHIHCHGYLGWPDERTSGRRRCWIYNYYNGEHGPLSPADAMAHSCNIFFFTLGQRLGARRLVTAYHRMGLGQPLGCGLSEEVGGFLPNLADADYPNAEGFTEADAIQMGIGQGPIAWTPLQAASAYATLARGGYFISPTFLLTDSQQRGVDLGLDKRGVELALEGLRRCVNESYGTAHHLRIEGQRENIFNVPGVRLYGKTGTADTGVTWLDENGDGQRDRNELKKRGDNAWTIVLVQRDGSQRPDFVIAVVVEFGGSGSQAAGPVAHQIVHALRAEGYL